MTDNKVASHNRQAQTAQGRPLGERKYVASIALVLGIHRFMSESLVPTNLIGNAVATIVVSKWEGALDEAKMRSVLAGESEVEAEEPGKVLA